MLHPGASEIKWIFKDKTTLFIWSFKSAKLPEIIFKVVECRVAQCFAIERNLNLKFACPHMISHEWFPNELSYLLVKNWVSHVLHEFSWACWSAPWVHEQRNLHVLIWFLIHEFHMSFSYSLMKICFSYPHEFSCNEKSLRNAMFALIENSYEKLRTHNETLKTIFVSSKYRCITIFPNVSLLVYVVYWHCG